MELEKKENTDYTVLREQLKLLSQEFQACKSFILDLDAIVDKKSFKRFLERNMENICDKLNIDGFNEYEYEVEELEDENRDLRREIDSLEDELDDLKHKYGNTNLLVDEFKAQHFCRYKDDYTEMELEELLKNGKELIKV